MESTLCIILFISLDIFIVCTVWRVSFCTIFHKAIIQFSKPAWLVFFSVWQLVNYIPGFCACFSFHWYFLCYRIEFLAFITWFQMQPIFYFCFLSSILKCVAFGRRVCERPLLCQVTGICRECRVNRYKNSVILYFRLWLQVKAAVYVCYEHLKCCIEIFEFFTRHLFKSFIIHMLNMALNFFPFLLLNYSWSNGCSGSYFLHPSNPGSCIGCTGYCCTEIAVFWLHFLGQSTLIFFVPLVCVV